MNFLLFVIAILLIFGVAERILHKKKGQYLAFDWETLNEGDKELQKWEEAYRKRRRIIEKSAAYDPKNKKEDKRLVYEMLVAKYQLINLLYDNYLLQKANQQAMLGESIEKAKLEAKNKALIYGKGGFFHLSRNGIKKAKEEYNKWEKEIGGVKLTNLSPVIDEFAYV